MNPKVPPQVRWIFFDLDQTLWDHKAASRRALERICEHYGLAPEDFLPTFHKVNNEAWDALVEGQITRAQMRDRRFRDTLARLASPPPRAIDLLEINKRYLSHYLESPGAHWLEGAFDVIAAARRGPWGLAILTNGALDTQTPKVENGGMIQKFDFYWGPENAGCLKPLRGFFQSALEHARCSPNEALMIGDSLGDDVFPALEMGMNAWWINIGDRMKAPGGLQAHKFVTLASLANAIASSIEPGAGGHFDAVVN